MRETLQALTLLLLVSPLLGQAAPQIQVVISPPSQTAAPGETIAFTIQVNAPSGWTVDLAANISFPCKHSIKPSNLRSGQTAVLLLTPGIQVQPGSYRVAITAQHQSEKVEALAQVQIVAPKRLTVQVEPGKLALGINTTILFTVVPAVPCVVTLQGLGLNRTMFIENGKGQIALMPPRVGVIVLMVQAQGYAPHIETIQVEGYQGIDFAQYIVGLAILIVVLVVIFAVAKIVMRRGRGRGDEGRQRRPPPPPPSGPGSGVVCPTCGTLADTRFCPRCGTRIRPH